jgi:hypothetical protein
MRKVRSAVNLYRRRAMILQLLTAFAITAVAGSPVSWRFSATVAPDGRVLVILTADLEAGWHLYATELPGDQGPLPTEFRFSASADYRMEQGLSEPEPVEEYDPNFGMVVRHHSGKPQFTLLIRPAVEHAFPVEGEVEFMLCNDRTCLPPEVVRFSIPVQPVVQKN